MAVVKSEKSAKLILKVQTDTNAKGDPVYRQRSFSNLNPALSDDETLAIGQALGALQAYPVDGVGRQDSAVLANA